MFAKKIKNNNCLLGKHKFLGTDSLSDEFKRSSARCCLLRLRCNKYFSDHSGVVEGRGEYHHLLSHLNLYKDSSHSVLFSLS